MAFLYMSEDIMDPSPFLDAADSDLTEWSTSWQAEEVASSSQVGNSRKRRATENVGTESSSENCSYKIGSTASKQSRGKTSGICTQENVSSNNSNGWQPVEELGNNLSDDLDGACSLTGLGVDLNSSSYNISDALLTLPLSFKQEVHSPGNNQENGGLFGNSHLSPTSANGIADSPQSCSSHGGNMAEHSSASNSPPRLLQMVVNYDLNGEPKDKCPIPVCLVVPDNHQGNLNGQNKTNNCNAINSRHNAINGRNNQNRNNVKIQLHEQNNSVRSNETQNNKRLLILSTTNNTPTTHTTTETIAPLSVVQPTLIQQSQPKNEHSNEDCRFQYVLAAATSIATKVNEETQTYLNQGQSYEIKLKKLGDLSHYRGKILKSVVRLSFHERRLQYMEGEQMAAWVAAHPSLKILEVDLPLSYGIVDVLQDRSLNYVEFLWDPTKEVGVYIKVNCISTEFTPNKHGGEKGVPFRIQVETYLHSQTATPRKLHTASCQVKVFKLKGADRKHKQDREKILKRPPSEQEKYQPSYECTVLNDMPVPIETNYPVVSTSTSTSSDSVNIQAGPTKIQAQSPSISSYAVNVPAVEAPAAAVVQSPLSNNIVQTSAAPDFNNFFESSLSSNATVQQVSAWLQANRFSAFIQTFANFSGIDLLRLSRDNLIQICGLPEGIRLFNALVKPQKLTLYVSIDKKPDIYHALYLAALTNQELVSKVSKVLGIPYLQIENLFLQGRYGFQIIVSDEVVNNFKDESYFIIEINKGRSGDKYNLLLKPAVGRIDRESSNSS